MEVAQIFLVISEKTPEFVIGFALGLLLALFIAYVYLLPRFVKSATASLSSQVELLAAQVVIQTSHIKTLEEQVQKLEKELEPYRQFAEQQLTKVLMPVVNPGINT